MYKALFEMSETRADFLSGLFARKRPAGLSEKSTAAELFDAYAKASPDMALQRQHLRAMRDLLMNQHKFALRPADLEGPYSVEYVYSTFVDNGVYLNYMVGNNPSYADLMEIDDGTGLNRSYLATEDNYRFVRDMERKNLIIPLVGDFGGPKTIRAVAQYLKDHDATVSAFYLSNVEQYLFNDFKQREFYDNVAALPLDPGSTFIRTFSGGGGGFRFVSTLSSMKELLDEVKAGRVRGYGDVRNLSK
jgi:hypothetical protein